MKQKLVKVLAVMLAAVVLAGCGVPKEEIGTVVGAGLGGLAGSFIGDGGGQLVAVGVGTLVGAMMGSEIGKSLDRADKLALAHAQHEALEDGVSGSTTTWQNPDSGNSGEIVTVPTAASSRRPSSLAARWNPLMGRPAGCLTAPGS